MDYDFVIALSGPGWKDLPRLLSGSPVLAPAREGASWRPDEFRRFIIGTLPDGRDERLEFWRHNHLLAPFGELRARRVMGAYGGGQVAFLGLDDLIRSKETEREDDWRDVRLLEEIADDRLLASVATGVPTATVLAGLRSQRRFETARLRGLLAANDATREAAASASHPVSLAFLAPFAHAPAPVSAGGDEAISALISGTITGVEGGSARHLALVEAVRRLYRRQRMAEDRSDKERAVSSG